MELNSFLKLVEDNKRKIAQDYYEEVKNSDYMKTYHKLDGEKVIKREEATYDYLTAWIKNGAKNDETEKFFCNLGKERFKEGFPLSELNFALYISKKAFYNFIKSHPEILDNMNKDEIIEFFTLISNYFALAGFYMVRGYINTLFDKLDLSDRLTREELQQILIRGAFDEEDLDFSDFVWRHV
jgi:hypothetical protein